jgi:hypothetical protein
MSLSSFRAARSETRFPCLRNAFAAVFRLSRGRALILRDVEGTVMSEEKPQTRSGLGWGCLTAIIVVVVIFVGGLGLAGYYILEGYKTDATFQTVLSTLQANPVAKATLGDHIALSGFPSFSFRYENGVHTADYDFTAQGSKTSASVHAETTINGSKTTIDVLRLAMPDGRRYDLVGHASGDTVWLLPRPRPRT